MDTDIKLTVAILFYSRAVLNIYAADIVLSDQNSKHKTMSRYNAFMEDGTKYLFMPNLTELYGITIDQLIIVDDFRWNILYDKCKIIKAITMSIRSYSCVPEQYQIQKYELQ